MIKLGLKLELMLLFKCIRTIIYYIGNQYTLLNIINLLGLLTYLIIFILYCIVVAKPRVYDVW